jgi:hypothetical protein
MGVSAFPRAGVGYKRQQTSTEEEHIARQIIDRVEDNETNKLFDIIDWANIIVMLVQFVLRFMIINVTW